MNKEKDEVNFKLIRYSFHFHCIKIYYYPRNPEYFLFFGDQHIFRICSTILAHQMEISFCFFLVISFEYVHVYSNFLKLPECFVLKLATDLYFQILGHWILFMRSFTGIRIILGIPTNPSYQL